RDAQQEPPSIRDQSIFIPGGNLRQAFRPLTPLDHCTAAIFPSGMQRERHQRGAGYHYKDQQTETQAREQIIYYLPEGPHFYGMYHIPSPEKGVFSPCRQISSIFGVLRRFSPHSATLMRELWKLTLGRCLLRQFNLTGRVRSNQCSE